MRKHLLAGLLIAASSLTGCSAQTKSSGLLGDTSLSSTTNQVVPAITAENSTIDCSGWTQDAQTYLRNQGVLKVGDTTIGIGFFSCGAPNSELSTEFVESFIFTDGAWAGNGVVPGPRIQFMTMQPCTSAEEIICPALKIEEVDIEIEGSIIVSQKDGNLSWRFEPNT